MSPTSSSSYLRSRHRQGYPSSSLLPQRGRRSTPLTAAASHRHVPAQYTSPAGRSVSPAADAPSVFISCPRHHPAAPGRVSYVEYKNNSPCPRHHLASGRRVAGTCFLINSMGERGMPENSTLRRFPHHDSSAFSGSQACADAHG